MDPRLLAPSDVEAPLTPMGRKPYNRWIVSGSGGGPYEARGWYPSTSGNRLAPGWDGLSQTEAALVFAQKRQESYEPPPQKTKFSITTQRSISLPKQRRRRRKASRWTLGQADQNAPEREEKRTRRNPHLIFYLMGASLGIGLAYITYDELWGTGAYLRRGYAPRYRR